jgi:hypothetical protein
MKDEKYRLKHFWYIHSLILFNFLKLYICCKKLLFLILERIQSCTSKIPVGKKCVWIFLFEWTAHAQNHYQTV